MRKSASLLTKTQRQRIQDSFEPLEENQRRRDQQRIRERLKSGVVDFRLLVDYPDRQLEMAFEDLSDEELKDALADAYLVLRRIQQLREYDETEIIESSRAHAEELGTDQARSLEDIELRTQQEVRAETRAALLERLEENPWERNANRLLKVAGGAFAVFLLLSISDRFFGSSFVAPESTIGGLVALTIILSLTGLLLIKAAQVLKQDVVPLVRFAVDDPRELIRYTRDRLRRPVQTIKKLWQQL